MPNAEAHLAIIGASSSFNRSKKVQFPSISTYGASKADRSGGKAERNEKEEDDGGRVTLAHVGFSYALCTALGSLSRTDDCACWKGL